MESGTCILTYFTILLARAIIYIHHLTYLYIYTKPAYLKPFQLFRVHRSFTILRKS